tara:strand:- start:2085 stop:2348 length:264 start_codon:yes stop_codon:yes gene_type:complete
MKTLLKFEADWCGPCQQIKPLVDEVLSGDSNIQLRTINVDDRNNLALMQRHGVRAIPTLVLLDEDEAIVGTHRGALNRQQLKAFVAA